jgi:predicted flap endonuclease-1-like 5' DNA nuclease
MKLSDIEGIGPAFEKKLTDAGITNVENLLEKGAAARGRKEIAETTGIDASTILEWINRADLYRIKGVGSEYSDLLEAAGVDSVPELATRNPEHLTKKLEEINSEKDLVRRTPALSMVEDWVAQAKKLPKVVSH